MEERKLNFNTPLMSVRRISTSGPLSSDNNSVPNPEPNTDQVTEPVAVPFMWEHIPGIAKNRTHNSHRASEKESHDRAITELLRSSESPRKDEMEGNGSELDNDVYSDALESLSSPESISFSFNCSVSGMSGSDGSARKPSGTFLVDPQTRDIMMSRFLPAARAMALEPPQYASRKQQQQQQQLAIVPYEQPKEAKKESIREIKMLPRSDAVRDSHGLDVGGKEDESEEEIDEVDEDYGIVRGNKGCGLIPKLCLLNPIPGMKVRTRSNLSVSARVKKTLLDGCSPAKTRPVAKNSNSAYNRYDQGTPSPKTPGLEKLPVVGMNRLNISGELQATRGSISPFRRSTTNLSSDRESLTPKLPAFMPKSFASGHRPVNYSGELRPTRNSLSPYRNSREAPKPLASGSSRFNFSGELGMMRGSVSPFRQPRAGDLSTWQNQRSRSPLARNSPNFTVDSQKVNMKTIYVDSVNVARNSISNSNSSDREAWMDPEVETPLKSSEGSDLSMSRDLIVLSNEKVDFDSDSVPPLLKSPSESWLYRTLPSVPSRSPFTPKKQSPKLLSYETKWETIVKSSKLCHDHVRYSEELITHKKSTPNS